MISDQPPPTPQPERLAVWDLVIDDTLRTFDESKGYERAQIDAMIRDMGDRDRLGRERYGTPLTTHNGRDHIVDAYQELLDGAVYLRAEIEEKGANYVPLGMHTIYLQHLQTMAHLHSLIWQRR